MAQIPEFIGLMKWIRETAYPPMKIIYDEMRQLVNARVETPVETVPLNPDGSTGDPFVDYDKTTGVFKFGIPAGIAGDDGQSLAIEITVPNASDLTTLSGNRVGQVAFASDTTMIYIWQASNQWSTGIPFAPTSTWTALTDCQNSIVDNANELVVINPNGTGLVTLDKTAFLSAIQAQVTANAQTASNAQSTANTASSIASTADNKADSNTAQISGMSSSITTNTNDIADLKTEVPLKIGATDYATNTVGGTIKIRVIGNDLYISTNAGNADGS